MGYNRMLLHEHVLSVSRVFMSKFLIFQLHKEERYFEENPQAYIKLGHTLQEDLCKGQKLLRILEKRYLCSSYHPAGDARKDA